MNAHSSIARSFSHKASSYEKYAVVQARVLRQILELFGTDAFSGSWVDLGCGTGLFEKALAPDKVFLTGIDIALQSLIVLKKQVGFSAHPLNADICAIPLKNQVFDRAVSASVIQWISDQPRFFKEAWRVIKPGGLLAFAGFCTGTLPVLSLLQKTYGIDVPVFYRTPDEYQNMALSAGFSLVQGYSDSYDEQYDSVRGLLGAINGVGGAISLSPRIPVSRLRQFCRDYEQLSPQSITGHYRVYYALFEKKDHS